jgi:hypothetical protein
VPPIHQNPAQNAVRVPVILPEGPLVLQKNNEAAPKGVKARSGNLAPDPRRETAQMAAKAHWADWARKKAL